MQIFCFKLIFFYIYIYLLLGIIIIFYIKSMEIIKINIDTNFPLRILDQINSYNKTIEFSPIWQSIWWNLMLQDTNYIFSWIFVWVFDWDILLNFVIIEKRSLWLWLYGNFIIWGLNSNDYIEVLEKEIIKIWIEEKVVFTQIESLNDVTLSKFKNWAYKKFIEKCTAIINITDWKEKILANMKQKWRYNIKVAEKNNIEVNKIENTEENIYKFYKLLSETKERDSFNINSQDYFTKLLKYLYSNDLWWLYFATKKWDLIASWIFVNYLNTTYYYYWASTSDNEKRKYMASYLLQWNVIMEAIDNWMNNFDFLWITCPWCKSNKLAWVTDFKQKLTPLTRIWPDSKIILHKKFMYSLLRLKNLLKKLTRK